MDQTVGDLYEPTRAPYAFVTTTDFILHEREKKPFLSATIIRIGMVKRIDISHGPPLMHSTSRLIAFQQ